MLTKTTVCVARIESKIETKNYEKVKNTKREKMFYVDLTNEDKGEEETNKIEKNESKVNSGKQSYFK